MEVARPLLSPSSPSSSLLAAAQAQQMLSFSANDTDWKPTQSNRTLVSPNGDFAAGFLASSSPGKFRFTVWVNATPKAFIWYAHPNRSYTAIETDNNSALTVDARGKLSWTVAGNTTIGPHLPTPRRTRRLCCASTTLENSSTAPGRASRSRRTR
ncbi:hypothetical protein GUJ93_ZPchr0012g20808 [Zizania palustris]|uniref:Bulb-type lectin domain-containing protein n=1 Tax=Zizania palustris TaxID=103762 RepID=A0A8J5WUN2_ZIZPA|nr:hypothetical protein GUJ93_ZPchr0012g20808 [Zizania palustris]